MLPGVNNNNNYTHYTLIHKCQSASCVDSLNNNNNELMELDKPLYHNPSVGAHIDDISPIRCCGADNVDAAVPCEMDDFVDEKDQTLRAESGELDPLGPIHRPTSIPIGPVSHTYSLPLTSSPIGCTLNAELGADLHRSLHSESFKLNADQADADAPILNIRIFYPSGKAVQFPVENGQEAMAADLLNLMTDHLGIDEEAGVEALALWLISPLLEVQLKPYHVAFEVRNKWSVFLRRFTTAKEEQILFDEPLLVLKRNVHMPVGTEISFEDEFERLTEVLYLDAKDEFMGGRCLVDQEQAIRLAALQMAVEFTTFESEAEAQDLLKEKIGELLPTHMVSKCKSFHLFGLSMMECRRGCEKEILDQYRQVSVELSNNHERRKAYLNVVRKTPFYGAAYFYGTTDRKPASTLFGATKRFLQSNTSQVDVRVGISHDLVTVVDERNHELLLVRRLSDCSWFRSQEANVDEDIPSFFLHFPDDASVARLDEAVESDIPDHVSSSGVSSEQSNVVSRLLQVFTKQAPLMDSLLNVLLERNLSDFGSSDEIFGAESPECNVHSDEMMSPARHNTRSNQSTKSTGSNRSTLSNMSAISTFSSQKLAKLCLATIDPQGNCIEASGTLRQILQDAN